MRAVATSVQAVVRWRRSLSLSARHLGGVQDLHAQERMAKARRRDTKHIASAQWHLDQAQQRLDAPSAAAPQRSQSQGHALNAAIGALRDASPRSHAADDVGGSE